MSPVRAWIRRMVPAICPQVSQAEAVKASSSRAQNTLACGWAAPWARCWRMRSSHAVRSFSRDVQRRSPQRVRQGGQAGGRCLARDADTAGLQPIAQLRARCCPPRQRPR